MQPAVGRKLNSRTASTSPIESLQRIARRTALVILAIAMIAPFPGMAQLGGTGTIEGTVTDLSGALVVGAKVSARNVQTSSETVRSTSRSGLYTLAPLDAGDYTITVSSPGFEELLRENIHLDGLQILSLNLTLHVGSASQVVTVKDTPPALETGEETLGAVIENDVYQSLPLEMGGANGISTDQRRTTDSALLMPGVTNNETKNNESDEPMVINGNASSSEMYIEGLPFESASVSGDPRYIWSAISVEAVDQFQVKTTAYSAEYQGLGVENFTIKSGTNQIHGSLYEVMRNTALDSAGFNPAQYPSNYAVVAKQGTFYVPPEHMNEYGVTIGGPIWKNKIFVFGNYMGFRFSALTSPQTETIPTPAELCGDFSALPNPIYDPTTQVSTGGTYSRMQFSGPSYTSSGCGTGAAKANVIPQSEISPAAKYLQQYWAGVDYLNSNPTSNYQGSYNYGLNNWSTTDRLDADISDEHKLSLILASGRQGLIGPAGSQTTQVGPLPYLYSKTYAPITRVALVQDSYVFNQNLVNQFNYGIGQYHAPDNNITLLNPAWAATASGITNLPSAGQAPNSFPIVKFSGTDDQAQWGPNTGQYVQSTDTDSLKDNVQWLHGKHSFTFGGQFEWLEFNDLFAYGASTPLTLSYAVTETAQVSGKSAAVTPNTGLAYASFLMGAVDSSSYTEYTQIAQETGSRYHPFAFYGNDNWKLTNKLTVNAGLRWDVMPPFRESEDRFSFLNPTMTNPITGNPGALQFAGNGTDGCNCATPMNTYYKDWGPRLGAAYALDDKTVVRAAYGIYYAHGGGTSGGATSLPASGMELGFSAVPNPPSPGNSLPAFYLNNSAYFTSGTNGSVASTAFGGNGYSVAAPPIYNAAYATYYSNASGYGAPYKISSTVSYLDPKYGDRTPTFEGWSFGIQRLLTKDITATVSYVGNQGHFLLPTGVARGYWGNQLDPGYLSLGSDVLGATATAANTPGGLPYPTFNNKVSQALLTFPQYSGVTDQVESVGNANYNALQLSIVQRKSRGMTFMLNYTYSKTIDDIGTFRAGYAIPAGALANSTQAWPIDRIERSRSVQDQPQNLVFTSTYDLPFGAGHIGSGNPIVRNAVGGWRISNIITYDAGNPLAIVGGSSTCTTPGSQGTCMPAYAPGFSGSARQGGGWGHGATRNGISGTVNSTTELSSIQYINPAAFSNASAAVNPNCSASGTACNGMVLGNLARTAAYGLRGPGNYDIDGDLRRTFDLWRDGRVKFIFEACVFNAVNHVWFGSPASTADGSIGSTTGSSSFGEVTGQANSPRQWQFAGHITF
jgi:hypothetical protein